MTRLGKRQLQELLYFMVLTRELESTMARLHAEHELTSPLHLERGFEALAVGAAFVPAREDSFCSSLPSLGSLVGRGVSPVELMLSFFGRGESDISGRDVVGHIADPSRGILVPANHAATHLGVMAGIAFADRYSKSGRVAVALVLEAAVATGDFHEAVNFAAVRRLPLVVLVARRVDRPSSAAMPSGSEVQPLYDRIRGYGIPGLPVEGNELLAVTAAVETAVARARQGEGPMLIEATVRDTVPLRGSARQTPSAFVGPDGLAPAEAEALRPRSTDPRALLELYLLEQQLLDDMDLAALEARAREAVRSAQQVAESAPSPRFDETRPGTLAG